MLPGRHSFFITSACAPASHYESGGYLGWKGQAVATSTGALANFVPWAPLQPLADAGVITACTFLLNTAEFRLAACSMLRDIVSRKQQQASSSCL